MKRFKNILFVADQPGIETSSFSRALELAHANNARLTVMDVVEPMDWDADKEARFGTDLTRILQDRRLDELQAMTRHHAEAGTRIHTTVTAGTPFLEVIRSVLRNGFDLVMKSAEVPRGAVVRPFGPNDQHLIRKCPCPVWIDRSDRPRPYRKIIAAVDPVNDGGARLDRFILDLATAFVAWEGAEVHVVHAWWLPGESVLRGERAEIPQLQVAELLETERKRHADALQDLLGRYAIPVDAPNVHFAKGSPASLIAETAQQLPADLIVIGTVGRAGIPGFFIGNTAESVIQSTAVPVLTVKPAGFESPVAV